jgi:hypothetical protein
MRKKPIKRRPVWLLTMAMLIIAALVVINRGLPETAAQAETESRIIAERAVDFPADI